MFDTDGQKDNNIHICSIQVSENFIKKKKKTAESMPFEVTGYQMTTHIGHWNHNFLKCHADKDDKITPIEIREKEKIIVSKAHNKMDAKMIALSWYYPRQNK